MDPRSFTWTLLKSWVVRVITFQPMDEIAIEPYFPLLTFLVQFLPRLPIKFVGNVLFSCSNSHRFTSRHREAFVSQQTLTGFTAQVVKRLLLNDRDDLFLFLFSSFSCISQEFDSCTYQCSLLYVDHQNAVLLCATSKQIKILNAPLVDLPHTTFNRQNEIHIQ